MSEDQNLEPVWCIRANIVQERPYGPGGMETRLGTKHFVPGAKVYCVAIFWDGGLTNIEVVGHHRGSHRYVRMIVQHDWLTNHQAELVYSPYIIKQLPELRIDLHNGSRGSADAKREVEMATAHLVSLSGRGHSEQRLPDSEKL